MIPVMKIDDFRGPYRWLSNFHMCPVMYEGEIYPSSEHAYMAAKTTDLSIREEIKALPKPGMAKKIGRSLTLRDGWDDMRISVMEEILRDKFTRTASLKQQLLDTCDFELIEGNTWNDCFWGVCRGKGENNLGKLLMKLRKEFRG